MMSFDDFNVVPNILTIDFESWVHTYQVRRTNSIDRKKMDNGFVLCAGTKLLDMLAKHNVVATFFIVSEISEWYPELIEKIEAQGHEIALHSHTHRILLSESDLIDEMKNSVEFIHQFNIQGFRAPRGFFRNGYLKSLTKFQIFYDSSGYGMLEAIKPISGIVEIPISAWAYSSAKCDRYYFGPLNWKMLMEILPFGSPFLTGLLGPFFLKCIQFENRRRRPTIICLHLWQVFHPEDRFKFMLWLVSHEILSLPYCMNCYHLFERLLETSKFITMRQFLDNYLYKIKCTNEMCAYAKS